MRRSHMNKTFILVAILLGGCATAPSQKTLDLRFDRAYEQQERELQFDRDKETCNTATTTIMIVRYGKATRHQEITNVPGRGDTWHCVYRH